MNAGILYRIDNARRMRRYRLDVRAAGFIWWLVPVREWGRIGSIGQARSIIFPTPQESANGLDDPDEASPH